MVLYTLSEEGKVDPKYLRLCNLHRNIACYSILNTGNFVTMFSIYVASTYEGLDSWVMTLIPVYSYLFKCPQLAALRRSVTIHAIHTILMVVLLPRTVGRLCHHSLQQTVLWSAFRSPPRERNQLFSELHVFTKYLRIRTSLIWI